MKSIILFAQHAERVRECARVWKGCDTQRYMINYMLYTGRRVAVTMLKQCG